VGREVLKLVKVKKRFGPVEVLKGVDLTLEEGDFAAVVGPSGSGKSTLLMVAAGLELPSEGEVYLFGRRIDLLSEKERDRWRRRRVAFVFQNPFLLEDFTVLENLEVFGKLLGVENHRRRSEELLKLFGLWHLRDRKPPALSGGERQRLAVARAVLSGAPLILADEPTGSLDRENALRVFELFRELNRAGTAFLVVTHNRDLLGLFKKVFKLRNGLITD